MEQQYYSASIGFADDLDITGNSLSGVANASRILEKASKKVGLTTTSSKTKLMKLIDSGIDPQQIEGLTFNYNLYQHSIDSYFQYLSN